MVPDSPRMIERKSSDCRPVLVAHAGLHRLVHASAHGLQHRQALAGLLGRGDREPEILQAEPCLAFGSKEELYREALPCYLDTHGQVVAGLRDETLPPREALEQALRRSASMQTDTRLPKGCMLVFSAANASPENDHLQALVAAERQRTRGAIRHCVERAARTGELRPDIDAEGLATLAEALLVGMSVQARDGVSHAAIEAAVSNLLQLWDMNRIVRGELPAAHTA